MEILAGLAFAGALIWGIGWAICKIATAPERRRLDALEATLRDLTQRLAKLESQPASLRADEIANSITRGAQAREATAAPSSTPEVTPRPAETASPARLASLTSPAPPASPVSPVQPAQTTQPTQPTLAAVPAPSATAAPATPRRPEVSLETFLGGRVMLVTGVVVGLFGVAFFLKFAIDHGWIGPAARVAMGGLAGVALLAGGDRLRRRGYDVFGQALMGCGLGAVYLSNYFACTKYGFFGQGGAFLVTAAITAAGAVLAVRRQAPVLAVLGFLGGYLAPALLATPSGELGGLTAWLLVVDAGVLAVLLLRAWKGLELLALAAAALYFTAWFSRFGTLGDPVEDSGCLAALVAASLLLCLAPPIVRREVPGVSSLGGAAGTGVFGVVAGHALLFPPWRRELGAAVLVLGALYVVASKLIASRAPVASAPAARGASSSLLGFAVAALATAIAVATSGNAVVPALSAAGVAVVFAGTRTRHEVLLAGGMGMIALAAGDLILHRLGMFEAAETPFLNERFALFACPCVAMLACGWLMSRAKSVPPATSALVAAAGLWALPLVVGADMMCGVSLRGDARFEPRLAATTAVLAIYGAVVARLFAARRDAPGRAVAFGPLAMALLFGLWLLVAGHLGPFTPGFNLSFAAGLVLVAAFLDAASLANASAQQLLRTLPLVYLLALVTAEIHAWGEHRPLAGFTRMEAEFVAVVWISIAWALYAAVLVSVGFWKRLAALRWLGLAVFALTVGKVFFVDMAGLQPAYRIGSFLALGALLIGASFLYQRARRSDGSTT